MIVAMHSSEGENPIAVSNFIGSPDDPLYSLKLSNTFYNKTYTPKCDENDEAKRIIASFLKRYSFLMTQQLTSALLKYLNLEMIKKMFNLNYR